MNFRRRIDAAFFWQFSIAKGVPVDSAARVWRTKALGIKPVSRASEAAWGGRNRNARALST